MKTLFVAYRVTDLEHSLPFCSAWATASWEGSSSTTGAALWPSSSPANRRPPSNWYTVPPTDASMWAAESTAPRSRLTRRQSPGRRRPKPAWGWNPSSVRVALTTRRRRGSRTRTVTGSSWWSGRSNIPTASPQQPARVRLGHRSRALESGAGASALAVGMPAPVAGLRGLGGVDRGDLHAVAFGFALDPAADLAEADSEDGHREAFSPA